MTSTDLGRNRFWAAGRLALALILCPIGAPAIAAAEKAVQAENNPPGDIPDNQVFVSYSSPRGFTLQVPEGWSRVDRRDGVHFFDKYNLIDVDIAPTTAAPNAGSVRAHEAAGLVLGLGLADRKRSFAILTALGAKPRQLGAFVWSEAALFLAAGTFVGLSAGAAVACVLVKLLTGVFDPPPEALSTPWLYLASLIVVAGLAVATAALGATRSARIAVLEKLRGEA